MCLQWLLLFRAAVGVGLGGAHVAFTLAMELTPTHSRSLVLVAVQAFWTLGSMLEVTPAAALQLTMLSTRSNALLHPSDEHRMLYCAMRSDQLLMQMIRMLNLSDPFILCQLHSCKVMAFARHLPSADHISARQTLPQLAVCHAGRVGMGSAL